MSRLRLQGLVRWLKKEILGSLVPNSASRVTLTTADIRIYLTSIQPAMHRPLPHVRYMRVTACVSGSSTSPY